MFRFASFLALALVAPIFATPSGLLPVQKYKGETSGKYIVVLKDGVQPSSVVDSFAGEPETWGLINGFAAELSTEELQALRASPDVASIEQDGIMHITETTTQTNAPWGLGRISRSDRLPSTDATALTYNYTYDTTAGAGVDVYIVDTGILTTHVEFEGRARWGKTFGGYADRDGHGHGTHCAGTIGSARYGVAKKASLIAVKVLSDSGSGSVSSIISGLNYVATEAAASGRPTIVSMSLGGSASATLDAAVQSLIAAGVHTVIAAGNDNKNAGSTSPARVPAAITVGASTISDSKASFSNFGAVIDIWAPGVSVISTWAASTTASRSLDGTSMATPHVAGALAYLIGRDGAASPAVWHDKIKSLCVSGALSGVPTDTVNCLLHV